VIRVAVVDDHPAVRAGLRAVLDYEPGIVLVGESGGGEADLCALVAGWAPDVVMLDIHLDGRNGLDVCRDLIALPGGPRVMLYSGYASPAMAARALRAGADALVDKRAPAHELLDAIRRVNKGERLLPVSDPDAGGGAGGRSAR
jgi:DNA-binding NarL/FixJ family response regulator